jgi:hypothetical protein
VVRVGAAVQPWGGVACRMVGVSLLIAPEVVAALGGPAQTRATLGRVRAGTFRCTECRQEGRYADEPAAVVVRMLDREVGDPVPIVNFAHPGCCGSRVEPVAVGTRLGRPTIDATGWIDSDRTRPRAVLLLATQITETSRTPPPGYTVELLLAGLRGVGFATVADLATPLPVLSGLHVSATGGRLLVKVDGQDLYDGPPLNSSDWTQEAAAEGAVRVLFATGIDVTDPDRDVLAELFTALGKGLVVGATGRYGTVS